MDLAGVEPPELPNLEDGPPPMERGIGAGNTFYFGASAARAIRDISVPGAGWVDIVFRPVEGDAITEFYAGTETFLVEEVLFSELHWTSNPAPWNALRLAISPEQWTLTGLWKRWEPSHLSWIDIVARQSLGLWYVDRGEKPRIEIINNAIRVSDDLRQRIEADPMSREFLESYARLLRKVVPSALTNAYVSTDPNENSNALVIRVDSGIETFDERIKVWRALVAEAQTVWQRLTAGTRSEDTEIPFTVLVW